MLTKKQKEILNDIVDGGWSLNSEGLVDVTGSVYWSWHFCYADITNFQGIKFGKITRYFSCLGCSKLESLEGSPISVGCYYNLNGCYNLKSLGGISRHIWEDLYIQNCTSLHSLKGIGVVGGIIYSEGTPLIEGYEDLAGDEQEAIQNSNSVGIF